MHKLSEAQQKRFDRLVDSLQRHLVDVPDIDVDENHEALTDSNAMQEKIITDLLTENREGMMAAIDDVCNRRDVSVGPALDYMTGEIEKRIKKAQRK